MLSLPNCRLNCEEEGLVPHRWALGAKKKKSLGSYLRLWTLHMKLSAFQRGLGAFKIALWELLMSLGTLRAGIET